MIIIKYVRISVISSLLLAAHPAHALSLSGLKEKIKTCMKSKKAQALGAALLGGAGVAWWWYMTCKTDESSGPQRSIHEQRRYESRRDRLQLTSKHDC